jgi:AcrR family transcriptional regulator
MIKQTFYNLPDYKRQRVINAVVYEFANAESDKVSINHIVQNAEISRGSFYQYFDDKSDLFFLCIRSVYKKILDARSRNHEDLLGAGMLRMKELGYDRGYQLFSEDLHTFLEEAEFRLFDNLLQAPPAIRNYVQMSVASDLIAPVFRKELQADPNVRKDIDYDYYAYLLSLTEVIPVDYAARHGLGTGEAVRLGFEYMRSIYESITK